MDDEQRQLVVERAGVTGRLRSGDGRADDDVTEQHRHRGAVGLIGCRVGGRVVERERQHIGGPVVAEVLAVERGDLVPVDERQGELAATGLGTQRVGGEPAPSLDVDVDVGLLVGAHHHGGVGADGGTRRLAHRCTPLPSCRWPRLASRS